MREESPRRGNPEADAVRAELARARRSQGDAAKHLNLSQPAMSRRLTGEVDFTVAEIRSLADWLGIPVTVLLGHTPAGADAGGAHPLLLVAVVLVAWVAAFNTPPGTLLVGLIGVCGAVVLAGFAWAAGVRTLARRAVVARGRRD